MAQTASGRRIIMEIYLAIITTVLVVSQIVRCVQNAVQLRRQRIVFEKQLKELADMELTERDFETQRMAYRLIVEYLEDKVAAKMEVSDNG
jgi:hypothetical protein